MNLGSLSPAFSWSAESSKDSFYQGRKSPKLRSTPSKASFSFSLPSDDSSSTSSASSLSSASAFWTTPAPPRWSFSRLFTFRAYSTSRKQLAAACCVLLVVVLWLVPLPQYRRHHATYQIPHPTAINPYQVLQPTATTLNKHAPIPTKWLEVNSNNKYATNGGWNWPGVPGRVSNRPRAALISLVRNSELAGIVQSMTQLEHHWNHKYNYPWVFFNDEPFSDIFKVRGSVNEAL